jgi:hypothetical protein
LKYIIDNLTIHAKMTHRTRFVKVDKAKSIENSIYRCDKDDYYILEFIIPKKCYLTECPLEIILIIIEYLDIKDIHNLCITNKKLFGYFNDNKTRKLLYKKKKDKTIITLGDLDIYNMNSYLAEDFFIKNPSVKYIVRVSSIETEEVSVPYFKYKCDNKIFEKITEKNIYTISIKKSDFVINHRIIMHNMDSFENTKSCNNKECNHTRTFGRYIVFGFKLCDYNETIDFISSDSYKMSLEKYIFYNSLL